MSSDPERSISSTEIYAYEHHDKQTQREEKTQINKVKDQYQSHLHELLVQKQALEKELRWEKTIKLRLQDEI